LGEAAAREFLEAQGWTVRNTNYRAGREEVDLVVERGKVLAFVEVKTRSGPTTWGSGLAAIDPRKQVRIRRVAAEWLRAHGASGDTVRFDAVHVIARRDGSFVIEHLSDAWR